MIAELRQRRTFRVAATYFVIAWLLVQVGDILLGNFGAPDWVFKTLVLVIALGFPIALFVAWFFGEQANRAASERQGASAGRTKTVLSVLSMLVVTAMALALIWLVWDKFRGEPGARAASVAVLPFADMSSEGDQEYFADGLSEEILNLLAGIRELKVSGRTSSFSFKGKDASITEIGQQLGVAHVLEGSVRKAGDELRVTAQLIEADEGFHLWSETYDRELNDVFAIQDDIAAAIANQLALTLVDSDGRAVSADSTDSMEAYDLYLEARRLVQGRSVEGIERAGELLDQALELDGEFAPALAESALARLMLSDARITPGDRPLAAAISEAESLLERALEIDPRLAEAHAVSGLMHILERDVDAAESALSRALERNPSQSDALNWRAINLRSAGRLREELRARRRLADIDPLNVSNRFNLVIAHVLAGDEANALNAVEQMREDFPDSPWSDLAEFEAMEAFGRLAEADRLARHALESGNDFIRSSASGLKLTLGSYRESMDLIGGEYDVALLALGQVDEAVAAARDRAAASPRSLDAAHGVMYILSRAGRHEAVLEYYDRRWGGLGALERRFGFDDMSAEVIPIAAAQYHLGREEALAGTIAHWRERLATPLDQGYDMPLFRVIRASLEALDGRHERAVELLNMAIDAGYRDPQLTNRPALAGLRGHDGYKQVVTRNFRLINAEREALDLPPLPQPE
ncbi:tetratricopeptide repeat protein [Wenzhouxiangella sp. EGI_FJ10409]|uniref:tetratricopeptide repeat protein n=1 Tax=Wenzhouxiangella sp. EGI_FJ10409 TaxID=3243767 RepID=UPI0035DEAD64